MPSGPVRIGLASVQDSKPKKKGAMSSLSSKLSSQKSMVSSYPVKSKKKK